MARLLEKLPRNTSLVSLISLYTRRAYFYVYPILAMQEIIGRTVVIRLNFRYTFLGHSAKLKTAGHAGIATRARRNFVFRHSL
jgi:hypothetical protein